MQQDKMPEKRIRSNSNEGVSPEDVRAVIRELKRKSEEEFQERLKKMTPEEREKALEWANYMD